MEKEFAKPVISESERWFKNAMLVIHPIEIVSSNKKVSSNRKVSSNGKVSSNRRVSSN